jgi:tetratricopeptide (TPR) repeat protein
MQQRAGGILSGRILCRGSMLWAAMLSMAALTIAGFLPGCQHQASTEDAAVGNSKPESTPVAQTPAEPATADTDHAYADLIARGDAFGLQGDFATAIDLYTQAVKLDPRRAEGYSKRAASLYNSGAPKKALVDYNEAIQRSPADAELYLSRAIAQLPMRTDLALADCDTAVRLSPQLEKPRLYRANVHLARREFDSAIDDYNAILAIMPTSAASYCNRGAAYRSKGDFARAIADYTTAIRYNTQFADAYNNRGEIYLRQTKYDRAMADFNEALRINPAAPDAHDNRGDLYLLLGKPEPAIADYTEIIDRTLRMAAKGNNLHPGERLANVYLKRASAHLKADHAREAIADVGEAVRINPQDARAYAIRRDAYLKLGQTESARVDDDLAKRLARPEQTPSP